MAASGTAIAHECHPITAPPLRVSFSWTLVGNIIYAATQFGMLSALAKLGSPSIVGQYALALAISAPVFMLTNLQLRGIQATDARNEYQFADYFTLRCLSTLTGVLTITTVVAFGRYDQPTTIVILLVAAAKGVETLSDVIAGHLQKSERLDQVARAMLLRGLASVVTFTTAFWVTRNLAVACLIMLLTWLITISLYDFSLVSRLLTPRIFFHFSLPPLRRLLWLSLPLGIAMALNSLSTNIPRYLLEHELGRDSLGVFASLAYVATAMGLIAIALGQSVLTRLSQLFAHGDLPRFEALLLKLLALAGALGVGGVVLVLVGGRSVLTFIYRPEYAAHVNLLFVMVVDASVTAASVFLGFAMTAARCFRSQIPIMVLNVSVTAALTLGLLPRYGLLGGGYALLISSTVQAGASYAVLRSAMSKRQTAI